VQCGWPVGRHNTNDHTTLTTFITCNNIDNMYCKHVKNTSMVLLYCLAYQKHLYGFMKISNASKSLIKYIMSNANNTIIQRYNEHNMQCYTHTLVEHYIT